MFTGIDFIVGLIFFATIGGGAARGFLGTLIDLTGIVIGLTLSSVVYMAPVHLFARFNISGIGAELFLYLTSCLLLTLAFILFFEVLRKRVELKAWIDRFFGALLGSINGLFLASALLIVFSASIEGGNDVGRSMLAKRIQPFIPKAYQAYERKGFTLPKMILLPKQYEGEFSTEQQRVQFIKLNFTKLEGSTCTNCGGKVHFSGYFTKRGAALVPKFTCPKCGRTSDGCQTYEVFHALYGYCPVDIARKGKQYDCGNWPNREWITPKGPCPVDGKELDIFLWKHPVRY
ncbi:MAG: CvpA family protein [Candidatus Ratteibacteria bacterium]|jgi:uncharacterized membrane protein required for colicin V production/predicted RNA-binding Zn-ribbon protein involved in translation (DUF1610 family)